MSSPLITRHAPWFRTAPALPRPAITALAIATSLLAPPAAALEPRVNFAKYQQVTASVSNSSHTADFAVDGIASDFHSHRTGPNPGPHWLEVAFPRPVAIASAHLHCGLLTATGPTQLYQNFRFQHHDGAGWIDIPGSTVTGNASPEVNVIFAEPATATRFRLFSTDEGNNRAIRQLALFPPNVLEGVEQGFAIGTDVRVNLAWRRPTVASSINNAVGSGANFAIRATDGHVHNSSRWFCLGGSPGQTLEIDLLADHAIGSAHLFAGDFENDSNPLPEFVLEWWDGAAWQPIPGGTVTGNTRVQLAIPFDTPVTTSRVRLRTTSGSFARVGQLLFFPPRDGGYPLGTDVSFSPPPSADWNHFSDSTWRLPNRGVDLRLAVVNGRVIFGNGGIDGFPAIEWRFLLNHRDGSYRLFHPATGLCLALGEISTGPDVPLVVEPYSGMPQQDWLVEPVDGVDFRIISRHSGHAVQSAANATSYGAPMVVRAISESALQRWRRNAEIHHPKKGIAATHNPARPLADTGLTWLEDSHARFNAASWSYTWGRQSRAALPFLAPDHTFNPMQWGNFNWAHGSNQGPIDLLRRELQAHASAVHLMGFNEPEKSGQANMSVAAAIDRWPRLEAMDVPLVSPAPASAFNGWMADFAIAADALGYRRDITAVHWYGRPNATNLINHLQNNFNTFGRPVWLTEFSTVDWNQNSNWTHADNYEFLAEFMWRAEFLPWLKRYSLFQFIAGPTDNPNQGAPDRPQAPRSNARNADGSLTPFGELYAAWDGVTDVLTDHAYHIHNRGEYQRMHNPGDGGPTFAPPENSGTGTRWTLTPGNTANTRRILSVHDGRPLRFVDGPGAPVTLGDPGLATPATEWRLAPDQHGRFFIEHPASNKRLRNNGDGTYGMVPITNTGQAIQWRFIPALMENSTPPDPLASYPAWAAEFLADLPPAEQTTDADPDHDGLTNLMEFLTGNDPLAPDGNPLRVVSNDASSLALEFPWNWRAGGYGWLVRHSDDLRTPAPWPTLDPATAIITRDGDVDWIRLSPTTGDAPRGFYILEVFANPGT